MKNNICVVLCVSMVFGFLGSGCGTTKVDCSVKLPPRVEKLRTAQSVYVVEDNFHGNMLGRVRAAVSKGQMHKLLDSATVAAGNQPTVIVEGQILNPRYDKTQDSERVDVEKKCTKRSTKGKKECLKWEPAHSYHIYTIKESCTHGLHSKISDGSNAQLLQERDFLSTMLKEGSRKDKWPIPMGQDKLCGTAFAEALGEFQKSFVPYKKQVRLVFVDIDDSEDAKKAVEAAELGALDRSKGLFLEALKDTALPEESRAWARFNLAIVHEAMDEFADCAEQIDLASEILGSDSKVVELKNRCEL